MPARRFGSAKGNASVKFRLSISSAVVLFGIMAALGLAGLFVTSGYALKQLRVGGPLYNQIKLGNDLIADVLPPPEYVLEAYLEVTLALREPDTLAARKDRLIQLRKDYDERRAYWTRSDLDPALKALLTETSHVEVARFWEITQVEFLPAIATRNSLAAEASYRKLQLAYNAHRAIIDDIVKKANDINTALESVATAQDTKFTMMVWIVSALVALVLALGLLGISIGVIRPVVRMTSIMKRLADGDLNVEIPSVGRRDEVGSMAKAVEVFKQSAIENQRLEQQQVKKADEARRSQRDALLAMAETVERETGKSVEFVGAATRNVAEVAIGLTSLAARGEHSRCRRRYRSAGGDAASIEQDGHEVSAASNGLKGLKTFETENFDLLIVDIFMPGMDGLETIRIVHQQRPDLPIIVISGRPISSGSSDEPDFLAMATKLGAITSLQSRPGSRTSRIGQELP